MLYASTPALPPSLSRRWRYGEVSGCPRWKGMAWGMLPCLGSAMCACTWHFFYNSPDLDVSFLSYQQLAVPLSRVVWVAPAALLYSSQDLDVS